MAIEQHLEFSYTRPDVVSAQQMRIRNSGMFYLMGAIWLGATLYLIAQILLPHIIPQTPFANWRNVIQITIIFAIVAGAFYFAAPWLDFRSNQLWKNKFTLHYSDAKVRMTLAGKNEGLELKWNQIKKVLETPRVYLLQETDRNFIIVPKSSFRSTDQEQRFRSLVRKRAAISKKNQARLAGKKA